MTKQKTIKFKTTENKFTQEVIDEILRVKEEQGLTAQNLLNNARNKKNPLHNLFEWNDKIAGEQYRLQLARVLINEVKIIVDSKEIYAFENVNIGVGDNSFKEYKDVTEIMDSKELRMQIIKSALNHVKYWKQKYADYNEFEPIVKAIDKVEKKFKWQKH